MSKSAEQCPSSELLERWLQHDLTESEAEAVRQHLDQCSACREKLRQLAMDPVLDLWVTAYNKAPTPVYRKSNRSDAEVHSSTEGKASPALGTTLPAASTAEGIGVLEAHGDEDPPSTPEEPSRESYGGLVGVEGTTAASPFTAGAVGEGPGRSSLEFLSLPCIRVISER